MGGRPLPCCNGVTTTPLLTKGAPMNIDFCNPEELSGRWEKIVVIEDPMDGDDFLAPREKVLLTLWLPINDSRRATNAAARVAGIALLERALEALRRT
jgi:hypothetical protein